jgi:hypothetical protein
VIDRGLQEDQRLEPLRVELSRAFGADLGADRPRLQPQQLALVALRLAPGRLVGDDRFERCPPAIQQLGHGHPAQRVRPPPFGGRDGRRSPLGQQIVVAAGSGSDRGRLLPGHLHRCRREVAERDEALADRP